MLLTNSFMRKIDATHLQGAVSHVLSGAQPFVRSQRATWLFHGEQVINYEPPLYPAH